MSRTTDLTTPLTEEEITAFGETLLAGSRREWGAKDQRVLRPEEQELLAAFGAATGIEAFLRYQEATAPSAACLPAMIAEAYTTHWRGLAAVRDYLSRLSREQIRALHLADGRAIFAADGHLVWSDDGGHHPECFCQPDDAALEPPLPGIPTPAGEPTSIRIDHD